MVILIYLVVCCGINFHSIYLTAPSAAPEAVLAVNISSTEIMVSWDEVPPIHRNGIITMYEVHYEPVEMFDGVLTNLSMLTNGPNMSIVLDGLAENVIYRISVRAFTSVVLDLTVNQWLNKQRSMVSRSSVIFIFT